MSRSNPQYSMSRRLHFAVGYVAVATVGLLMAEAVMSSELYRCVDHDGVRYSDRPCGPHAELMTMPQILRSDPVSPPVYSSGVAPRDEPPEKRNKPQGDPVYPDFCPSVREINTSVRLRRIRLCMTKDQVESANRSSEPSRKRYWNAQGDLYENWFYAVRDEDWPREIRFKNGIVRSFGNF